MPIWMPVTVHAIHHWHSGLFSLQIAHPGFAFKAGQFARLALPDSAGEPIPRAYSMVNKPGAEYLEFVIASVPGGQLSPRLQALQAGDELLLNSHPSGFFTLDHVPDGHTLWMLATGTGVGPYLSILQDEQLWNRFAQVRLVHAVRTHADLCYQPWLQALTTTQPKFSYHTVISREPVDDSRTLAGRIPQLISSGELEEQAGVQFDLNAQIMLCGNPAMIRDARQALEAKGLQKHLRRKPGQITMEQYWA